MTTPLDHSAFHAQLEQSIVEDTRLIANGQAERDLINAAIKEARERIATNERLLKALEGPKPRAKTGTKQTIPLVAHPDIDVEPFRPI